MLFDFKIGWIQTHILLNSNKGHTSFLFHLILAFFTKSFVIVIVITINTQLRKSKYMFSKNFWRKALTTLQWAQLQFFNECLKLELIFHLNGIKIWPATKVNKKCLKLELVCNELPTMYYFNCDLPSCITNCNLKSQFQLFFKAIYSGKSSCLLSCSIC